MAPRKPMRSSAAVGMAIEMCALRDLSMETQCAKNVHVSAMIYCIGQCKIVLRILAEILRVTS